MKITIVNSLWKKRKLLSFYLVFFVFSKGAVFLAPLILSNYLDARKYGSLEYGISIGNIFAMVLGLGIPSAYPYFIIKKKEVRFFSSFILYQLLLFIFLIIVISLFAVFRVDLNQPIYWAGIMAIIITTQTFFSSILKTHNKPIGAVAVDGGFYIYLVIVSGLIIVINKTWFGYLYQYLAFYYILFSCVLFTIFRKRINFSKTAFTDLIKILKYGFPLILTSFLIMVLSNSPRIIVEKYFDADELAQYSFYFRIASGVVLFHQFFIIVYFKQLFIANTAKLDKYLSLFFSLLLIITITGFFVVPYAFKNYFKLLKYIDQYREIYFLMVVLVIYWIAMAINEPLIYRENLAVKMNICISVILVTAALVIYILQKNSLLTLNLIVKCHFIVLFFSVESQLMLLRRNGINLSKTRYGLLALFAITFLSDYFFFR